MKTLTLVFIILLVIPNQIAGQQQTVDNGYEKGLLVDGYKQGIWEYYDDGELKLKVNYNTSELVYLAQDTSQYAIQTEQGWERSRLDIPPRYIGSMEEFRKIIYSNLRYPKKARQRSVHGTVLLGFEIGLEGKVENAQILHDIGKGCGDEVLRVFQLIPDIWLVPKKDGNYYRARFVLPVRFKLGKRTSAGDVFLQESKKALQKLEQAKADYSPAKYLEEITIAALSTAVIMRMD